ncbi:MAG: MaoC family dehydratase N-terminal domain-containing protein [Balneolaceae bacterium]|nr:MaoC family dehydratase N-terminal domain-containing protein [Balneolaceae bacterium]MCH8550103.1 hypothetical protein [Balneolaceae bacterium]
MNYDEWIGRSEDRSDSMSPEQLRKFEALMNRDPSPVSSGTPLSVCSHWAYFNPVPINSELAVNGTARTGELAPPIELPRRLWAGGKILFKKELQAGVLADKKSTITKIEEKEGESGKLCFVTYRDQVSAKGAVAIDETRVMVYREDSEQGAHPIRTKPLDIDPDWKKSVKPDSVQLFRMSALTFNSHRIHFDQDYARDVEGYPAPLVHAQLVLLLLIDAFKNKHDGKVIEEIEYRATGPVWLGEQITLCGREADNFRAELRAAGPEGKLAMEADVKWTYSWK